MLFFVFEKTPLNFSVVTVLNVVASFSAPEYSALRMKILEDAFEATRCSTAKAPSF